jgi:hypothetical protein
MLLDPAFDFVADGSNVVDVLACGVVENLDDPRGNVPECDLLDTS